MENPGAHRGLRPLARAAAHLSSDRATRRVAALAGLLAVLCLPACERGGSSPSPVVAPAGKQPTVATAQADPGALLDAAGRGDVGAVQAALAAGVDVNTRSPEGATALMLAADKGQLAVVETLLFRGADVNA